MQFRQNHPEFYEKRDSVNCQTVKLFLYHTHLMIHTIFINNLILPNPLFIAFDKQILYYDEKSEKSEKSEHTADDF